MDYLEFAARVKAKYPEYSDMPDDVLAHKMVAKFPQEYSDVTFNPNVSQAPLSNLPGNLGATLAARFAPEGMRQVFQQAQSEIGLERGVARGIGKIGKAATEATAEISPLTGKAAEFILPQDEFGGQALLLGGPLGGAVADAARAGAVAAGPAASALSAGAKTMLRYAESRGIKLTAADLTGSKTLASIENFLEKTPFGSNAFQEYRQKSVDAIRALRDRLSEKFGTSEDAGVLGEIAQNAIVENSKARAAAGDALYDAVGDKAVGAIIPQTNTAKAAIGLLEKEMALRPEYRHQGIMQMAADTLGVDAKAITEETLPFIKENATGFENDFANWSGLRRKLGDVIEQNDAARKLATPGVKFLSSAEAGAAKYLFKANELDLAAFAANEGGDLKKAYDIARAFNAEGRGIFTDSAVRRVLNSNEPGKIVDVAFRPNAPEAIIAVKKAAGERGFGALRRTFVEEKLIPEVGDKFTPEGFQKVLDKYGEPVLREVFSDKELMQFKNLANISSMVQNADKLAATAGSARTNVNIASHVITSVAGLGGLVLGGPAGAVVGSTGVILGQKALAQLYLSDTGRKLLLEGIKTPAISPRAAQVAGAITAYLGFKAAGGRGRNP